MFKISKYVSYFLDGHISSPSVKTNLTSTSLSSAPMGIMKNLTQAISSNLTENISQVVTLVNSSAAKIGTLTENISSFNLTNTTTKLASKGAIISYLPPLFQETADKVTTFAYDICPFNFSSPSAAASQVAVVLHPSFIKETAKNVTSYVTASYPFDFSVTNYIASTPFSNLIPFISRDNLTSSFSNNFPTTALSNSLPITFEFPTSLMMLALSCFGIVTTGYLIKKLFSTPQLNRNVEEFINNKQYNEAYRCALHIENDPSASDLASLISKFREALTAEDFITLAQDIETLRNDSSKKISLSVSGALQALSKQAKAASQDCSLKDFIDCSKQLKNNPSKENLASILRILSLILETGKPRVTLAEVFLLLKNLSSQLNQEEAPLIDDLTQKCEKLDENTLKTKEDISRAEQELNDILQAILDSISYTQDPPTLNLLEQMKNAALTGLRRGKVTTEIQNLLVKLDRLVVSMKVPKEQGLFSSALSFAESLTTNIASLETAKTDQELNEVIEQLRTISGEIKKMFQHEIDININPIITFVKNNINPLSSGEDISSEAFKPTLAYLKSAFVDLEVKYENIHEVWDNLISAKTMINEIPQEVLDSYTNTERCTYLGIRTILNTIDEEKLNESCYEVAWPLLYFIRAQARAEALKPTF